MSHIFPTRSRSKHAKTLSFHIGAEALSRALDGVPQHAVITCDFYAGNPAKERDKDKVYVMSVAYSKQARNFHHSEDAGQRGVFDPRSTISVYAVPLEWRHDIKTAMMETGLPDLIKPWLVENEGWTGKTGGAAIWLEYDLVEKRLLATYKSALMPEKAR
jgi:hypothetical protein